MGIFDNITGRVRTGFISVTAPFSDLPFVSFASVRVSRLVLNLSRNGNVHTQHPTSIFSEIAFSAESFVGNLGAPVRVRDETEEEDDPEECDLLEIGLGHERSFEEHDKPITWAVYRDALQL